MYDVYQAMSPKLTYQDLANTFAAVYAETYWNVTFMDATILAKSMVQTVGLDLGLAQQYAAQAMTQWRGMLSRKNLNDVGATPVTTDFTASPDIVCNENTGLNLQAVIQQWNNPFWQQPTVNKNYVYLRCQNLLFHGGITKPSVTMYYTTGGFNQPPTSWIRCYTVDGNKEAGSISSIVDGSLAEVSATNPLGLGERAVSEAFFFTPTSQDHVCVIGAVGTEYFTNVPNTENNWDSQNWITHNGAAAWHNVDPQRELEDNLKFYNQDDSPEDFYFSVACQNVPVGTKITLRNDDSAAAFNTGVVEVSNLFQEIKQAVTLPAKYEGTLKVRLESANGGKLAAGAAVKITMFWRIKPTHQYYAAAVSRLGADAVHADRQEHALELGNFTITGS